MKFILVQNLVKVPVPGYETVVFPDHMTHSDVWKLYNRSTHSDYVTLVTAGFYNDGIVNIGASSLNIATQASNSLCKKVEKVLRSELLGSDEGRNT